VRQARVRADLTQEALAAKAGLKTTATISNIERGVSLPDIVTLVSIADALAVPIDVLIGRGSELTPQERERLERRLAGFERRFQRVVQALVQRGIVDDLES
jgi:transcriptional regulator with XRE-family HTH domain